MVRVCLSKRPLVSYIDDFLTQCECLHTCNMLMVYTPNNYQIDDGSGGPWPWYATSDVEKLRLRYPLKYVQANEPYCIAMRHSKTVGDVRNGWTVKRCGNSEYLICEL